VNEIGLQIDAVLPWFVVEPGQNYTRVSVSPEHAATWDEVLRDAVRRCYISDEKLATRANATHSSQAEILATVLPNPGSVMSGDFGEIVGYIYLASREQATSVIGPKRWRLKQDRTKPAPGSDVVQLILPEWPEATVDDRVVCAEIKAKATAGPFTPITNAIEGSQKDSTSRLTRTLVWLRERRLLDDFGSVTIEQLNRFINATEFPPYTRQFHAVAVICSNLVEGELATLVPNDIPPGCALAVLSIPDLRETYTTVYAAVLDSVATAAVVEPLA
jgi:HamA